MDVSTELKKCAFGNFDRNLYFEGDREFLLGDKISFCALLSSSAHQMPFCQHQGNLAFIPLVPRCPNSSTFFSSKFTFPP